MSGCLHAEYVRTFRAVRAAVWAGDGAALVDVRRVIMELVDVEERAAALHGFTDALLGHLEKAHVHFCRTHNRPECPGRVADA